MNPALVVGVAIGLVVGGFGGWVLAQLSRAGTDPSRTGTADGPAVRQELPQPPGPTGVRREELVRRQVLLEPPDQVVIREPEADTERVRLVEVCIDLGDRLRDANPALWNRLQRGLAEVGVESILPDGERFDPERHEAVGAESTDDPSRNQVVSTEFAGYADHGRVVRRPKVVVYRVEEAAR